METKPAVHKYKDSTEFLSEAVHDAEMLLEYSAKFGLDIKEDWISTIISARIAERSSEWNSDLEMKFWIVYKNLSNLVMPVTVESLNARKKRPIRNMHFLRRWLKIDKKPSASKRSVTNYLILALIFILVLLVVQVVSLKGTTLLNSIQNNNRRIAEIEERRRELRVVIASDAENERARLERFALESERSRLDQEISSSIFLLEPWVRFIRKLTSFSGSADPLGYGAADSDVTETETRGPGFGPPGQTAPEVRMNTKIAIIQEAQNFTHIMQLYILPLLYGLIGGFVFVLRGLAYDIKHQVFSGYSNIKYSLRIHLGALAGLIVGLLWGDIESTQISFLESLSTGAIAFIAGYGVEYVFNGLDSIINNLSGKPKGDC